MALLKELSKERLVIIVSHNLNDAKTYADRIIELSAGKIINDYDRNKDFDDSVKVENETLYLPFEKLLNDEERNDIINEIPAGRFLSAKEAADIIYDISMLNPYVTGQIITADGGYT